MLVGLRRRLEVLFWLPSDGGIEWWSRGGGGLQECRGGRALECRCVLWYYEWWLVGITGRIPLAFVVCGVDCIHCLGPRLRSSWHRFLSDTLHRLIHLAFQWCRGFWFVWGPLNPVHADPTTKSSTLLHNLDLWLTSLQANWPFLVLAQPPAHNFLSILLLAFISPSDSSSPLHISQSNFLQLQVASS